MTEFQVGDRVSVEGIVEQVGAGEGSAAGCARAACTACDRHDHRAEPSVGSWRCVVTARDVLAAIEQRTESALRPGNAVRHGPRHHRRPERGDRRDFVRAEQEARDILHAKGPTQR